MEERPDKPLTSEEKEKLKERLALVKKEYKRTFNRLQRSQRAERVKTHVKNTIEEQNRLLSQESTGSPSIESVKVSTNSPENVREGQNGGPTPSADKERKLSVTFNLDPEILQPEGSSSLRPALSGQQNPIPHNTPGSSRGNRDQTPRSRLKLKKNRNRNSYVESPANFSLSSRGLADKPQQEVSALGNLGSPVFKKQTICPVQDSGAADGFSTPVAVNKKPADTLLGNRSESTPSCNFTSDCQRSKRAVNRSPGLGTAETDLATAHGGQKSPACSVGNTPERCGTRPTWDNSDSYPGTFQAGESNTTDSQVHRAAGTAQTSPLSSCTLIEGLLFPVEYYVRTTRRMSSCQRKVDLDAVIHSHLGTSRRVTRGRGKQDRLSGETDSSFLAFSPKRSAEMASGTSTPRVTPVSQSSAGKMRGATRGRRGRSRGARPALNNRPVAASPDLKVGSVQPAFGAAGSLTSGSQSEKENCEERSPIKPDPQIKPACPANETEKSVVKEGLNSVEEQFSAPSGQRVYTLRPRNSDRPSRGPLHNDFGQDRHKASKQGGIETRKLWIHVKKVFLLLCRSCLPGSPFPRLSRRISLAYLSGGVGITDFHLPDEEFGDLKLEKLKTASHLELVFPKPHTERKRKAVGHNGVSGTWEPPAGTSLAVQESERESTVGTGEDFRLSKPSENCLGELESINVSLINGPVSSQLCLTPDLSNVLGKDSFTEPSQREDFLLEVCETKAEDLNLCKNEPFPCNQSHEEEYLDSPRDTECMEEQGISFPSPTRPLLSDRLLSRDTSPPATKRVETHEWNPSKAEPCFENRPQGSSVEREPVYLSRPSDPKDLATSILFSTSICSVPLEALEEIQVAASMPGLPVLGSTPAFPTFSHQHRDSTVTCTGSLTQSVVSMETLLAGVTSDELASLGSGGRVCTQSDVQAVSPLGGGSEACESTRRDDSGCDPCDPRGEPVLGHPVWNPDGKSSQVAVAAGTISKNVEERTLENGHLRLVSQIQDSCGGSCLVDLCSVWWEFPEGLDLCILAASETSVCLWRSRGEDQWEAAHTWTFTEMPVIQIVPLAGEKNVTCVALGNLDIREIWLLWSGPGSRIWEQHLLKCGPCKIAQGLSRRRIASSSGLGPSQLVEVLQLPANGSNVTSYTLLSPDDSVLAFCEVDGERNALVGSTMNNKLVLWNSVTGQLLSSVYVGDLCHDAVCLSASSDCGLLFVVLVSPYSNSNRETNRKCIFQLIAANPRGGRCVRVMQYTLPEDHNGRYLEGDVKAHRAAAVLTCGSIALWELPSSPCSTLILPATATHWSLVRWGCTSSSLLTGQKNGTIHVYMYTGSILTDKKERCR
ncbi:partner and localizer of BRCA2 [Pelodytes ibericus]